MEVDSVQASLMSITQTSQEDSLSVEYGEGRGGRDSGGGDDDEATVSHALGVSDRALREFERHFKSRMADVGAWGDVATSSSADANDESEVLVRTLQAVESVRSGCTDHLRAFAREGLGALGGSGDALAAWLERIAHESRSVVFSVVVTMAPSSLSRFVGHFYRETFREYVEAAEARGADHAGGATIQGLMGAQWCARLSFVGQTLNKLGLSSQSEHIYTDIVFAHLKSWLEDRAADDYASDCLREAQAYNHRVVMAFLSLLLESNHDPSDPHRRTPVPQWKARLDFFIFEILGKMRTREMFDIVVDFPDSIQALRDLKTCLERTNFTDVFIRSFSTQLRKRLLHLGAATPDILTQYVSSIKALNILDPSGILSSIICPLVKKYLKKRKDTTRCVVNMVVYDDNLLSIVPKMEESEVAAMERSESEAEDGGGGTGGGLGGHGGFLTEEANPEDLEDFEVVQMEMKWGPMPIQAAQLFNATKTAAAAITRASASKDIVSSLIDVLGNKEYFIKEYKMILAERLLSKVDDSDMDEETRILELLKLRFGANSLRDCEVMLKDMADSRRITSNIGALASSQSGGGAAAVDQDFSAVILSELFWPPLFEGQVATPAHVQGILDAFGSQYKALKAPRTLHWKPHLGVVDLELCFGEETKEFTVSIAQALIISQFEWQLTWESEDLAAASGVALDCLADKAQIWVQSGVLRKKFDRNTKKVVYALVEDPAMHVEKPHANTVPDISVMSQEQQMEMNMKVYESYIMGMVTNLESLPLEKIHNMLKMFVLEPVYDKTLGELEAFLARLVNDGKLTFDGIVYRKKKR